MNRYDFEGFVEVFGKIAWSECRMTTWASSDRKGLTNIKYNIRKQLGFKNNIPLRLTGRLTSDEGEIIEFSR